MDFRAPLLLGHERRKYALTRARQSTHYFGNLIRTEVTFHSSTTCQGFRTCKALRVRCRFLQISAPVGVLTECATEGGLWYTTHANNRDCPHPHLCHLAIHGRQKSKIKNARPDCNTAPTLGKFASNGETRAAKQEGRRRQSLSMYKNVFHAKNRFRLVENGARATPG